jgi:hypothetical protein
MLLPIALLLHIAEEWYGGFPQWTALIAGEGLEPERFLLISSLGFLLFSLGTLAAFQDPSVAWLVVVLAALVVLNAALHTLATVAFRAHSPGTVTGLVLYLPLGILVLRSSAAALPRTQFAGAVVLGLLLHAFATLAAFA